MKLFGSNKSNSVVWTVRITDSEHQISNPDGFGANIDNALTAVEMGDEEFVVLSPSAPINNYTFLQACPDNESGYLHIEAGLNENNSKGFPKILCKIV